MIKSFLSLFSLPIFIGIIAGIALPFQALELIFLSNSLLFALMFINSLAADTSQLLQREKNDVLSAGALLLLLFVFFPCVLLNLSQMALTDSNYILGFAFSCVAPTAFVAPFFCKIRGGNERQSLLHIFVSTLVFPAASFVYLTYVLRSQHYLDIKSVTALLLLITVLPMALGLLIAYLAPGARRWLAGKTALLNSVLLGVLMFILCGSSFNKLRLSHLFERDILTVVALLIALDFAVYFATKLLSRPFAGGKSVETMAVSVSLRNLAIPAGLLLSFQPKAAIVPALGLVIHAFFFQWLARSRRK